MLELAKRIRMGDNIFEIPTDSQEGTAAEVNMAEGVKLPEQPGVSGNATFLKEKNSFEISNVHVGNK